MGVVLPFKRREAPVIALRSAEPIPLLPFLWGRQMVYDYPVFRMETDGEYAARLKRLES